MILEEIVQRPRPFSCTKRVQERARSMHSYLQDNSGGSYRAFFCPANIEAL